MTRRQTLATLLLLLLAFSAFGGEVEVVFYHTSDMHEHSANLARIADFVAKQRETENVIFVDSGDWNNKGDLTALHLRGEPMAALMGVMGYDAIIPGNHDYSFGGGRLVENIDRYNLPFVACNARWTTAPPKNVRPWRLFEFDGVTVGVIGTATAINKEALGHATTIAPQIDAVRKAIAEIEDKADIIVLLTHQGDSQDAAIIKQLPRLDAVLAGHQHRCFTQLNYIEASKTVLQHSGTFGNTIGRIALRWDGKAVTGRDVRIIKIAPTMPEAPEVAAIVKQYVAKLPK